MELKGDEKWLRAREQLGDELGWHPHSADVADLTNSHEALGAVAFQPRVARLGKSLGSNQLMQTLASLGLRADSTALPGRRRQDQSRSFDWSVTPDQPYYPGAADYRSPGPEPLPILEIPFSMVPIQAPYDKIPLKRYVNLAFKSEYLASALARKVQSAEELVVVIHPADLLAVSGVSHPLLAFSVDTAVQNLAFIVATAQQAGREVVYSTLSGVVKLVEQGHLTATTWK